MSFLGTLGKIALGAGGAIAAPFTGGASLAATLPSIIGAAGAGLGAASQASASNRGTQIDAALAQQREQDQQGQDYADQQQRYENELINREAEGRSAANDALKGVLRANYIKGRTSDYQGPRVLGGATLPTFGFGPKASTADEIAAATKYGADKAATINSGNTIAMPTAPATVTPFTIDPSLLKSGLLEKLGGLAGAGLQTYGALNTPGLVTKK